MSNHNLGSLEGRRKHLGQIALVFKHRHGTWADFGRFLKFFFSDLPSVGEMGRPPTLQAVECRHNPGGRHNPILVDSVQNPQSYPMFAHERYGRPCVSIGAFEEGKNPGLVVADICRKASGFLASIGRGDPGEPTRRDFDFEPAPSSPYSPPGSSQEPDSQGAINPGNITTGPRIPEEDSFDGADLFDDEDVVTHLQSLAGELEDGEASRRGSFGSVDTPSGYAGSDDSVLQRNDRPSIKMRAATLAYLRGFADRPNELREEFRRLRRNADLHVLHLCGCGLCYKDPGTGKRIPGCAEYSHLRLGLKTENDAHRSFHMSIGFSPNSAYAQLCDAYHQGEYGRGIF